METSDQLIEAGAFLEMMSHGTVLVVGDVILDRYVSTEVDRISPEAPVPVLKVLSDRSVAGGAANVVANVAALGGRAVLVGLVGCDDAALELRSQFVKTPSVDLCLVECRERRTTTKTRYLGGVQQMMRVDVEDRLPPSIEARAKLCDRVTQCLQSGGVGCVVISDYCKGLFDDGLALDIIELASRSRVPVLVDPKTPNLEVYKGASLITPNIRELETATGLPCRTDEEVVIAANRVIAITGANVLVTRSELGMSYLSEKLVPVHIRTDAIEVFDVCGAGDTVIAAYALAMSVDIDPVLAMRIANAAAGVVVAKHGTAVVTRSELLKRLDGRATQFILDAPTDLDALLDLVRSWKAQGKIVGLTNGCFDVLHPGHVRLIREAAAACDRLVVAINTDRSVSELKGADRPYVDQASRARVISSVRGVDAVILFDEQTPLNLIKRVAPDLLVKGSDYGESEVVGGELVREAGGRVMLVELYEGHSSSELIEKIKHSRTPYIQTDQP